MEKSCCAVRHARLLRLEGGSISLSPQCVEPVAIAQAPDCKFAQFHPVDSARKIRVHACPAHWQSHPKARAGSHPIAASTSCDASRAFCAYGPLKSDAFLPGSRRLVVVEPA